MSYWFGPDNLTTPVDMGCRVSESESLVIQQILNRNLLFDLANSIDNETTVFRRSSASTPMDSFAPNDRDELRNAIVVAKQELSVSSSPANRRGSNDLSLQDANAYMARSPEVSNLQSAAEFYYQTKKPQLIKANTSNGRRGGAGTLAGSELSIFPEYLSNRRLFGKFEQTDVRWIGSLLAEGIRKFRGRRPFVARPIRETAIPLPDENLRIVVVGDWGSGIPRAQKIGTLMRRELDSAEAAGWQKHVIHLGDVYYSGWEYEYRDRFLKYWPVKLEEKDSIGSFNLNGNHDMYSGGWAYFDFALADPRFAAWQGMSSLFTLANNKWQLFGLDTSHTDAALAGDQPTWLQEAALPGRKAILMSHHQFSSSFETPATAVVEAIKPVLSKLEVAAWLWGHEHRCMTFQDVPGIRYPACIGHGGVPVYQTHDIGGPLPSPGAWEYRDYVDGGLELWAKFGFATLDFYGDTIKIRYINEDGDIHRTETIV